jgi:hypothetical protein
MEITFNQNGLIATQLRTHAPQKSGHHRETLGKKLGASGRNS